MSIEHGMQLPSSASLVFAAGNISLVSLFEETADMSVQRIREFQKGLEEMDRAQELLTGDLGVRI